MPSYLHDHATARDHHDDAHAPAGTSSLFYVTAGDAGSGDVTVIVNLGDERIHRPNSKPRRSPWQRAFVVPQRDARRGSGGHAELRDRHHREALGCWWRWRSRLQLRGRSRWWCRWRGRLRSPEPSRQSRGMKRSRRPWATAVVFTNAVLAAPACWRRRLPGIRNDRKHPALGGWRRWSLRARAAAQAAIPSA